MSFLDSIDQPTLLIDENGTRRNIRRMIERANANHVDFRPHFKTHQSATVGEWFREMGVERITVSSVEMAEYFAANGWNDILIAFSLNPRQVSRIDTLAARIHLEVLIENVEGLTALSDGDSVPLGVWIKVDVGNGRTGLDWQDVDGVSDLCRRASQHPRLRLMGLLTHSGHSYHASNPTDAARIFREGIDRLSQLRDRLYKSGINGLCISVGDTPGCTICDNWRGADEVRPGNFVFYDAMQVLAGVCTNEDVSMALACPVVAKHPERREVVIYGGAIHLSKDLVDVNGKISYGLPALQAGKGRGAPIPGARVDRLSQEHGILHIPGAEFEKIAVGDLVFILPAHSCLTVQVMGEYFTLTGEKIETLNRP